MSAWPSRTGRRSRASSAAERTPDEAEAREKGEWGATAAEGVVPAELGGSDAPREMLDEDPELDSSVLGRTTGSDEPATEDGVDLERGRQRRRRHRRRAGSARGRRARPQGHRRGVARDEDADVGRLAPERQPWLPRPWTSAGPLAIVRLGDDVRSVDAADSRIHGLGSRDRPRRRRDRGRGGDRDRDRRRSRGGSPRRPPPPRRRSRWCASRPPSSAGSRGSTTPACGSCTPRARCERWRSASDVSRSGHLWAVALVIGLVAALIVAGLLALLLHARRAASSARSTACSRSPARSAPTPRTSRSSRRPRRCWR